MRHGKDQIHRHHFHFQRRRKRGREGTLLFNGKTHKLEFSANPHETEFTVDGQLLDGYQPMSKALADFFSEEWPDSDDDRWVVDDEVQDSSGEDRN